MQDIISETSNPLLSIYQEDDITEWLSLIFSFEYITVSYDNFKLFKNIILLQDNAFKALLNGFSCSQAFEFWPDTGFIYISFG